MKTNHMIISVGRECGCGEHEIAQKLASYYGIKLYDENIIQMIAERTNQDPAKLAKLEETVERHILPVRKNGFKAQSRELMSKMSRQDQLFLLEKSLIRELAEKESFVIVGRAANAILKDNPNTLRLFVYASERFKLPRVRAHYHLNSDLAALRKMRQVDQARRDYFEYYSSLTWGSSDAHDFMIDSSVFGIDGTVESIINMAERKFKSPLIPQTEEVPVARGKWSPAPRLSPSAL